MTTKDLIVHTIENLDDAYLEELYLLVQNFARTKKKGASLMERLKSIQIDAPEDFAASFDQYSSGEKQLDANIH